MADSKKSSGNVGGTIGMIIGLVSAAAPIVTAALNKLPEKSDSVDILVSVPDLYTKGFPLTLEQATEKLSSEGFGVIASKMVLSDAKAKYRDCIDKQIVDSRPKSREKVKPGTTVIIRYITQDVIDESKRLFVEYERNKAEIRAQKTASRQDKIDKIKSEVTKIFSRKGEGRKNHE